jgi:hypothetical protein
MVNGAPFCFPKEEVIGNVPNSFTELGRYLVLLLRVSEYLAGQYIWLSNFATSREKKAPYCHENLLPTCLSYPTQQ